MSPRWNSYFGERAVNSGPNDLDVSGQASFDADDIIVLHQLRKDFTDRGEKHQALRGLDLTVKRGEIHGVLGRSGAGKTTMLRCLLRLDRPESGAVIVEGKNWVALSAGALRIQRQRIGVVFQHFDLLASRTAAENIALPLEIAGTPRPQIRRRVLELLDWFGLADKAKQFPSRLSGGQRQRVALARALASSPSVLLADEPTSALDHETTDSVLRLLRSIREDFGITILIITHDLRAAKAICDRISILEAGRILRTGLPENVLADLGTTSVLNAEVF